jgi:hypothetical protein
MVRVTGENADLVRRIIMPEAHSTPAGKFKLRYDPYTLLCIHKSPNQADTYPAVCVKRATLLSDVNGNLTESHNASITCEAAGC